MLLVIPRPPASFGSAPRFSRTNEERDQPDELVKVCALTPFAREEFELSLLEGGDSLERARRVLIRSHMAMVALGRDGGPASVLPSSIATPAGFFTPDWSAIAQGQSAESANTISVNGASRTSASSWMAALTE